MTAEELAGFVVETLRNKGAEDIELIKVDEKTILADYFVLANGTSNTHIRTLINELEYQVKQEGNRLPGHIEGLESNSWVLLDYGDVIVHIFHPEERAYYNLDKLWSEQRRVLLKDQAEEEEA